MARALALQAKGHRFDSDILHTANRQFAVGKRFFKYDNGFQACWFITRLSTFAFVHFNWRSFALIIVNSRLDL